MVDGKEGTNVSQQAPAHDLDVVGIIGYLGNLIGEQFDKEVSFIYFGKG